MDRQSSLLAEKSSEPKPLATVVPSAHVSSPYRAILRILPPVFVAALAAAALLWTGTPSLSIARYVLYLFGAVVLPGTLVYRGLRGRPRTLIEDLAIGSALGFALELGAWAICTAFGLQDWLWTWPLLVVAVFIVVPQLRRHWWVRGYTPVPLGWSWAVAGIAAFSIAYLTVTYLAQNPLPPSTFGYYPDLLYYLSLAGEAQHHVPVHDPEVAGDSMPYHWFAGAHMASASEISGVALPTVLLRLWILPMVIVGITALAVVGWRITGRRWVGVLAAPLFWAIGEFDPWPWHSAHVPFGAVMSFSIFASPSQTYSYVFLIPTVMMLADRLAPRTEAIGRGAWPLAAIFLLASSGAKTTCLPILTAGLLFVVGFRLFTARAVPLRRRVPAPWLIAAGLGLGSFLLTTKVLYSGAQFGLTIGPLGVVWRAAIVPALGGPTQAHQSCTSCSQTMIAWSLLRWRYCSGR